MTQDPTSAVQGDIVDDDEVEIPANALDDITGIEDVATLIGRGLIEESIGTKEPEAAEAQTADEDDSADDEEGEAEPPAPTAAAETPAEAMERWLKKVSENPKSINEIPARHHPTIFERALTAERELQQRAAEMAYEQGMRDGATRTETQARVAAAVAEVDEVKRADPAAYVEWRESFPDRAIAYDKAKGAKSAPGPSDRTSATATIAAAAQTLVAKLDAYPAARARIEAKAAADPNLYLQTPEGLGQLSGDIADEIAADRQAALQKQDDPAKRAIEARQAAKEGRGEIPRPDTGGGQRATPSLPTDPKELIAMGWREASHR